MVPLDQNKCKELICLYLEVKALALDVEECGEEHKSPLNVLTAYRDALDSIMSLLASHTGMEKDGSGENIQARYIAARGHLRRAFFDLCDLLSLIHREKIESIVDSYGTDVVERAIPDYYTKHFPFMLTCSEKIAEHRGTKGVHNVENTNYESYVELIKKLSEISKEVQLKKPVLSKLQKSKVMYLILSFIIGVVSTIVASIVVQSVFQKL
ncbi:MAG: hypothetical protein LBQ42_07990 [Synergistaceae bacterium]|jgi:hypothetical protein|nr:hypothetical protein [Synergistaceae bacterium]